jgi:hypothetical protein
MFGDGIRRSVAHKGQPERIFRRSIFLGAQFTPEGLRRRAVDFVPVLSELRLRSAGFCKRWMAALLCKKSRELRWNDSRTYFGCRTMPSDAFRYWPKNFPVSANNRTFE